MNAEDRLKMIIGDLVMAKAFFEAKVEELTQKNAELQKRLDEKEGAP